MSDLSVFFLLFKDKIMFKSQLIKSDYRVLREIYEDAYRTPVFAPDYIATVLVAKLCTNSDEYSMLSICDIHVKHEILSIYETIQDEIS